MCTCVFLCIHVDDCKVLGACWEVWWCYLKVLERIMCGIDSYSIFLFWLSFHLNLCPPSKSGVQFSNANWKTHRVCCGLLCLCLVCAWWAVRRRISICVVPPWPSVFVCFSFTCLYCGVEKKVKCHVLFQYVSRGSSLSHDSLVLTFTLSEPSLSMNFISGQSFTRNESLYNHILLWVGEGVGIKLVVVVYYICFSD